MNPYLIDAHSHLQFPQYEADREEVIKRMFDKNIWTICAGSNSISSEWGIALAERFEKGIYATVGIHPSHSTETDEPLEVDGGYDKFDYEKMLALASRKKVVGIGEFGFEFFDDKKTLDDQRILFDLHLDLANEVKKPVVIHCRNGYEETLDALYANREKLLPEAGIMHFYSGDKEYARKFLDLGFSFTFGGALTLPKKADGADFAEALAYLPQDRILFETDAPYVAPKKYRGQRNEPAFVEEVLLKASEVLQVPADVLAKSSVENTLRVFNLI